VFQIFRKAFKRGNCEESLFRFGHQFEEENILENTTTHIFAMQK
jgi:hypothetical protein